MIAVVRLYQDSYGENIGSRIFCQLSKFFGGVLVTDNKKIKELVEFNQITHKEAIKNLKKFTKLIVYNTKPNMFGGKAPKHAAEVVTLILGIKDVYFYNSDPILDLQNSVPSSHEKAVPGLTKAIHKIVHEGVKLSNATTHFIPFLAAQFKDNMVTEKIEKEWVGCYFGNARNEYRQKQVNDLLTPLKSKLIIGYEHPDFPWFNYTSQFYDLLSTSYVTPIIGDKKLHYEYGTSSIRLYEACYSTSIPLIDKRFCVGLMPASFYFETPEEFHTKAAMIAKDKELYESMLLESRRFIKKIIRKYKNKKFNWKTVSSKKKKEMKERKLTIKLRKSQEVSEAKQRLINKGIMKPKRKKHENTI